MDTSVMRLRDRAQLFRAFAREVASALAPLGFVRDTGQLFASPMSEQVFAVLGLNKAIEADRVEVNPVMGLRHVAIESLIDEALRLPDLAKHAMTMGASLGYLMPDPRYRPVLITNEDDTKQEASDLALDVERFGLPFVRKHKELTAIARAVQTPPLNAEHRRIYTLPAAYFLVGDYPAAQAFLEEHLKELAGKNYPAAKQFRRFAQALLTRLSTPRPGGRDT